MKLISSVIALALIVCSVVYFANTSVASTASISYVSPVGTLLGPPANMYDFTSTTGSTFDVQLRDNSGTLLENLSNVSDASISSGIQVTSTVLNSLSSGRYEWKAKDHADQNFVSSATFTIP